MKFCHVDRLARLRKAFTVHRSRHAFINEILDNEFAFYYVALAEDTVVDARVFGLYLTKPMLPIWR